MMTWDPALSRSLMCESSIRQPLKDRADSASSKIHSPLIRERSVKNSMKDSPWLWKLCIPAEPMESR